MEAAKPPVLRRHSGSADPVSRPPSEDSSLFQRLACRFNAEGAGNLNGPASDVPNRLLCTLRESSFVKCGLRRVRDCLVPAPAEDPSRVACNHARRSPVAGTSLRFERRQPRWSIPPCVLATQPALAVLPAQA